MNFLKPASNALHGFGRDNLVPVLAPPVFLGGEGGGHVTDRQN